MIKDGGLNPEYFCVTDSVSEARRFFDSGKVGTIALLNDETRVISELLREFNKKTQISDYEAYDSYLIEAMKRMISRIIGIDILPDLIKPHVRIGWNDKPHSDGAGTILLCGYERPTEIATSPPVAGDLSSKFKEISWGNSCASWHPRYGVDAPISFLPATLIILTAPKGDNRRTIHRIPRQLHNDEQRGFILKAGYTY